MNRRNQVLAICAAIAALTLLFIEQPWRGDAHERTAAAVGPLFPDLARQREDVARIVVRNEEAETELQVDANRQLWTVVDKDHPADGDRIRNLVDMMIGLRTRDVVADSAESHALYDVAEGQGTRVQLYSASGKLLADWIHGKLRQQDIQGGAPPVLEFYVRRADRPEVFLTGDAFLPSTMPARWCDTRFLASLDDEDVTWVVREDFDGAESWRMERVPGTAIAPEGIGQPVAGSIGERWRMTSPETVPASDYAGDSLVRSLITLRASDVVGRATPEDGARYGFPQDRFRIGVGDQHEFVFELGGPAPNGGRYMRAEVLPGHVYLLSDFDVEQLRQPAARMLED